MELLGFSCFGILVIIVIVIVAFLNDFDIKTEWQRFRERQKERDSERRLEWEAEEKQREKEKRNLVKNSTVILDYPIKNIKDYPLQHLENIKIAKVLLKDMEERLNYYIEDKRIIVRDQTNLLVLSGSLEYETQFVLRDPDPNSGFFFSLINRVQVNHDRGGAELLGFDLAVAPRDVHNNAPQIYENASLSQTISHFNDWLNLLEGYKEILI